MIRRSGETPVVVDFWAEWCKPCKVLTPVLEEAVEQRDVVLATVDVEANKNLAREYGIASIPAVKAFKNGREVAGFVGVKTAHDGRRVPRRADEAAGRRGARRRGGRAGAPARATTSAPSRSCSSVRPIPRSREEARRVMVALFGELGQDHPLSTQYRRSLARAALTAELGARIRRRRGPHRSGAGTPHAVAPRERSALPRTTAVRGCATEPSTKSERVRAAPSSCRCRPFACRQARRARERDADDRASGSAAAAATGARALLEEQGGGGDGDTGDQREERPGHRGVSSSFRAGRAGGSAPPRRGRSRRRRGRRRRERRPGACGRGAGRRRIRAPFSTAGDSAGSHDRPRLGIVWDPAERLRPARCRRPRDADAAQSPSPRPSPGPLPVAPYRVPTCPQGGASPPAVDATGEV